VEVSPVFATKVSDGVNVGYVPRFVVGVHQGDEATWVLPQQFFQVKQVYLAVVPQFYIAYTEVVLPLMEFQAVQHGVVFERGSYYVPNVVRLQDSRNG
jgi:hypothetical protein